MADMLVRTQVFGGASSYCRQMLTSTSTASAPVATAFYGSQPHQQSLRFAKVCRAIEVSGPAAQPYDQPPVPLAGQISKELIEGMRAKICEALETDQVNITDAYGDGRHVSIDVVSKLFEGQKSVKRQRMVYKAIWMELQEAVHAVDAMTTKTPEESGSA